MCYNSIIGSSAKRPRLLFSWKGGEVRLASGKLQAAVREKLFAEEYLIDLNAERAAIRAGYSPRTARGTAYKLLDRPAVKEYIDKRLREKEDALIAKQDEVLRYLTAVMRGEETDEELVTYATGGYEKVGIRRQMNQLRAAESLAKRYGLLTDKLSVDGTVGVTIVDDLGE